METKLTLLLHHTLRKLLCYETDRNKTTRITLISPLEQCRRVSVPSYPIVPKWDHLQLWLLEADLSFESPKGKERTLEVIK